MKVYTVDVRRTTRMVETARVTVEAEDEEAARRVALAAARVEGFNEWQMLPLEDAGPAVNSVEELADDDSIEVAQIEEMANEGSLR